MIFTAHLQFARSTRRKMDLTTIMLIVHTIVMFGICTGHVCVILEYILTIFLYHNAATEGDVINGHDGRFVAFLVMLFLNVSVRYDMPCLLLTPFHIVHDWRFSRHLEGMGHLVP